MQQKLLKVLEKEIILIVSFQFQLAHEELKEVMFLLMPLYTQMNYIINIQNFKELYLDFKNNLFFSLLKFYDHNYHKIVMPLLL